MLINWNPLAIRAVSNQISSTQSSDSPPAAKAPIVKDVPGLSANCLSVPNEGNRRRSRARRNESKLFGCSFKRLQLKSFTSNCLPISWCFRTPSVCGEEPPGGWSRSPKFTKLFFVPAVGPGVTAQSEYKVPEYFCYDKTSYFEAEIEILKYRLPQPSSKSS